MSAARTSLVLLRFFAGLFGLFTLMLAGRVAEATRAGAPGRAAMKDKKIVVIAGPITGHPKNTHEYERSALLLKSVMERSPDLAGVRVETHFGGWPVDERTLDDADSIVMIADGGDRNLTDHPLYVGDRMAVLERQARRGCGVVFFHWSTFHPAKHHDRVTEWAGGYFDYETGPAANHWYSAIKTWEGPTTLGEPSHPALRGVKPFTVQEEFYYNIRFRANDPRIHPLLLTRPPGETRDYPVGWAVHRGDGGRSFGFTGGHFYKNWWLPDFRRLVVNAIAWTAGFEIPAGGVRTELNPPTRIMVVTGHNHPAHDWRKTTWALLNVLEQDPRVQVDVTENPEDLGADKLSEYDTVVLNYCNWDRPGLSEAARARFLERLRSGKGLVLIHFANGAFNYTLPQKDSEWKEFRTRVVARAWMHDSDSGHDPYGKFAVQPTATQHEITSGLGAFETEDELYFRQKGDLEVMPLVTARSRVTGADEPLAWGYGYGGGRIFQTLLGHGEASVRGAAALIRRGAMWSARARPLGFDPPTGGLAATIVRAGAGWTPEQSTARAAAGRPAN